MAQIPHTQGKHVQNRIPQVYFNALHSECWAGFSSCLLSVAKGKGLLPEGLSIKLCVTNPGRGAEGGRTWQLQEPSTGFADLTFNVCLSLHCMPL